jgi:AcrR family transcriptional regulator
LSLREDVGVTIARNPGRPRDPAVNEAIANACRELIADLGYADLTIEAVAERAGVGRPTIYRRWPSKAHMVWDVLFSTPADATVIGETADLAADVEVWIRTTMEFFSRPDVSGAFPGLLVDRSVEDAWHAHLREPVRGAVLDRLRRGVQDGELRPDADLAAIFDLVTGFAIYRAMVPQPVGPGPSVRAIVDQLLRGARSAP